MKTLRLVAATALVSSVFALSASAAEKEWWNVDFTSPTPNGVQLNVSELGALTNDASTMAAGTVQPYTNGVWSAVDSDESYVTNEFNPSGPFGGDNCLRLDTQGNDLTWTPEENLASNGVQTLVDADLYLVGSDSAPTDFDANNDVQAAIYLKNQTDDDSQETTNSVLCLYVWDPNINEGQGGNIWVDLAGADLTDQSWAHIQVKVDHSDVANPQVSVRVNDTQMYAVGDATATNWPVANGVTPGRITSVAFRGTGAVDNFVGKTIAEEEISCTFKAKVYFDNSLTPVADDVTGNTSRMANDWPVGTPVEFDGFTIDDCLSGETTYALSKIEILDPTDGLTVVDTINYTYTAADTAGESGQVNTNNNSNAYVFFEPDFFGDKQQGPFTVTVPTAGAPDGGDVVVVKIYFTHFNQQPSTPEVDVGEGLADYAEAHPTEDVPEPVAFNATTGLFEVSFVPPVAGCYVLMVSATVDGTYVEDPGSAVNVTTAGEPVTLTESTTSATAKFFKIGYGPAE